MYEELWFLFSAHCQIMLKYLYKYLLPLDGWLVVLDLTALWDSISVYIGPSAREREKEKK